MDNIVECWGGCEGGVSVDAAEDGGGGVVEGGVGDEDVGGASVPILLS